MAAQDPDELFDLYDERGRPLGVRKRRADVHRDGDWHRSLHLWIVLRGAPGAPPSVVLQRRGREKDTWPGAIDIAVTGHFAAGEDDRAVLREAEEEIGVVIDPDAAVVLGVRHRRDRPRAGIMDNEHQTIRAVLLDVAFDALVPSPNELESVLAIAWPDAEALFGGAGPVDAIELNSKGTVRAVRIAPSELVPASDGYYGRSFESLSVLVAGGRPSVWEIG